MMKPLSSRSVMVPIWRSAAIADEAPPARMTVLSTAIEQYRVISAFVGVIPGSFPRQSGCDRACPPAGCPWRVPVGRSCLNGHDTSGISNDRTPTTFTARARIVRQSPSQRPSGVRAAHTHCSEMRTAALLSLGRALDQPGHDVDVGCERPVDGAFLRDLDQAPPLFCRERAIE